LVYVGRFGDVDIMRSGVDDMGVGAGKIFIDVEKKGANLGGDISSAK